MAQGLSTPVVLPPAPLTKATQCGAKVPKAHREQSVGRRRSAPAQPAQSLLCSRFKQLQQRGFSPGDDSSSRKSFLGLVSLNLPQFMFSSKFPGTGPLTIHLNDRCLLTSNTHSHCTSHSCQCTHQERRNEPSEIQQGRCHWSRHRQFKKKKITPFPLHRFFFYCKQIDFVVVSFFVEQNRNPKLSPLSGTALLKMKH